MKLLFVLDMPNNNSWNGRWSGEGNLYARVLNFGTSKKAAARLKSILEKGYFYYNFGDGWGASVTVTEATAEDAKRVRKHSRGFCGYDWMIEEILDFGEIRSLENRTTKRLAVSQ